MAILLLFIVVLLLNNPVQADDCCPPPLSPAVAARSLWIARIEVCVDKLHATKENEEVQRKRLFAGHCTVERRVDHPHSITIDEPHFELTCTAD